MDIDDMIGRKLAEAFYTEVLGESRPSVMPHEFGTRLLPFNTSPGGNWQWLPNDRSTALGYNWIPVPLDGNQMMRGVRAMAGRGWQWGCPGWLGEPVIWFHKGDTSAWGVGETHETATARAALKAMEAH